MSYILEVELIVLAARLNVKVKERQRSWRTLGFLAWSTSWMDCHLLSSFNSGGRSCFGERGWGEDDEFSFGHFDFELEYPGGEVQ